MRATRSSRRDPGSSSTPGKLDVGVLVPVPGDFAQFWRDYEWMGAQRQLKVLGIFARLFHRDGKSRYLADMPRVMAYLRRASARYGELRPLLALLDTLERAGSQPRSAA